MIQSNIIDALEPLAAKWREAKIPILKIDKAKWLLDFVAEKKPKRILELGTAVGYSGTILTVGAGGVENGVSLVTIDSDANALKTAEKTFVDFTVDAQIIEDDVTEALTDIVGLSLFESFDLIFIDHSKAKYLEALEFCLKLSHAGTIIVADNISNPKCANFVLAIKSDARLSTSIIDIDDGISISIVKKIDK